MSDAPELYWPGKYDAHGRRVLPDAAALAGTWQVAERHTAGPTAANRLYAGDNLAALASLLPEFEGRLALIYLDPPFYADADFHVRAPVGDNPDNVRKPLATIELPAYRDTWPDGLGAYLRYLHERLVLMHRLLADTGSLFLHCDYRVAGYVRVLLDEVFGAQGRLVNEICWYYKRWSAAARSFQRMHDTIFFYAKSERYRFEPLYQPLAASTEAVHGQTIRVNVPDAASGKLVTRRTTVPSKGVLMHDVWEVPFVVAHSHEQLGYPTQKPIELLGRILDATTGPGDWVADFFAGSGAFLAAAEGVRVTREGVRTRRARRAAPRRWLAADASPQAVHATRKRLLALPRPAAAFEVWVLATAAPAAAAAGGRANAANGRPAVPHVQASGERLPDGRLRVCLRRYEPALAGLPPVSARDRAAVQRIAAADATGLAFVDLWAVDPAWQPGKPFDCRWHAQRPHRGDRRLPLETTLPAEAVHGAHGTVAVQVVDCFARETLHLLAL